MHQRVGRLYNLLLCCDGAEERIAYASHDGLTSFPGCGRLICSRTRAWDKIEYPGYNLCNLL